MPNTPTPPDDARTEPEPDNEGVLKPAFRINEVVWLPDLCDGVSIIAGGGPRLCTRPQTGPITCFRTTKLIKGLNDHGDEVHVFEVQDMSERDESDAELAELRRRVAAKELHEHAFETREDNDDDK